MLSGLSRQIIIICTLLIFSGVMVTVGQIPAEQEVLSYALANRIIIIDAGHGGKDPGAKRGEYVEKDITLAVSQKLSEYLSQAGSMVIMLRNDDRDLAGESFSGSLSQRKKEDLKNRVKQANDARADLYISIHANADPSPRWSGAQVFYNNSSKESKLLAVCIQEEITAALGNTNRKAKSGSYYVLDHTSMPSVIVEIGFISNPREAAQLTDPEYQSKMAYAIFTGIAKSLTREFDSEIQDYPGY